jgi:NTE family protein
VNDYRIGLALGSGSARGWAHIGIIQALGQMGIRPQVVSGCSIGALVGSAYAMGRLEELEERARGLGWKEIVGLFDISFNGGVIQGERLMDFFRKSVGDATIESLPIPFATVATDLMTGREVWFQTGPLYDAIRASLSLPGLFSPASVNGRFVIDGGLVNPVPVSLCRALGADLVIAVNLNSDVVGKHFDESDDKPAPELQALPEINDDGDANDLSRRFKEGFEKVRGYFSSDDDNSPGLLDVLWTSINIMQDRITRSRMAGDPPDVIIEPRLRHLQLMEFHRAAEAIEEGKNSVLRAKVSIDRILKTIGR